MIESIAALIGRHVHYWAPTAAQQHVRHDEVPFTARIVFVHPDGDVCVRGADHYGATFIDTHVTVRDVDTVVDLRHGGGAGVGLCTWPQMGVIGAGHINVAAQMMESPAEWNAVLDGVPGCVEPFGMHPPPAGGYSHDHRTDGEKRAALEVANVKQGAEDAKERRFQPMIDRAPRTDA